MVLKAKFQYEQELIENAIAVQHCVPREVKDYLAHFIKNALTGLIYYCKDRECQELLNRINATLLTIDI